MKKIKIPVTNFSNIFFVLTYDFLATRPELEIEQPYLNSRYCSYTT